MNDREIEKYISALRKEEMDFKNGLKTEDVTLNSRRSIFFRLAKNISLVFRSTIDFLLLKVFLGSKSYKKRHIVYTASNFCNIEDGQYEDRIVKPLFTENILFINTSKEIHLKTINNQKVFNIGGLAKLISKLFFIKPSFMRYFKAYQTLNNSIIKSLPIHKEIFLLWFYDLNSLSIIFSKNRSQVKLIEVQHGSIINYPPYAKPAPVKLIDVFYIKNQPTINYLKGHLCKNFDCEYYLIPYPKSHRRKYEGIHILYASTVDFQGIHPVFLKFLMDTKINDLNIQVRLHPRERTPATEALFTKQIGECGKKFRFDKSKNWIEGNEVENLIVISPWSSSIEDAYDNGYKTIIIDPAGKKRFAHLIDDKNCYFSEGIEDTLLKIAGG